MNKKTVRDMDLKDKRVLVRVDYNVPLEGDKVTDATRIRESIPTLKYILEQDPQAIILMSHLGRPKGKPDPEFSLRPVVPVLIDLLDKDVQFVDETVGSKAKDAVNRLPKGGILMLENTRFNEGETNNDAEFAAQLAQLGDVFINDAFGTAHRAHASNVGITRHLPAAAGFLLEKELDYLVDAVENPKRPFIAIIGGAKVSGKIEVIQTLLTKVDKLLIGGGMANTFLKARGQDVGDSLVEDDALGLAQDLMNAAKGKLILPREVVIADDFSNDGQAMSVPASEDVPKGWRILDIGMGAVSAFKDELKGARTIVWNGPMGVFEMPRFATGTVELAKVLAELSREGATTIIGGGDSVAAVQEAGIADQMSHVSTGGGASLELLEGKTLPGVAALQDK
ncbi:MAG: phosphoglycerate kinase [Chloroflexi bacterium]|nr:phosphoglycerate kinase [Chloroflexota bacterium]